VDHLILEIIRRMFYEMLEKQKRRAMALFKTPRSAFLFHKVLEFIRIRSTLLSVDMVLDEMLPDERGKSMIILSMALSANTNI
jgi:hypothetical protein